MHEVLLHVLGLMCDFSIREKCVVYNDHNFFFLASCEESNQKHFEYEHRIL